MNKPKDIYKEIATRIQQGQQFVVATIVAVKGSSPRRTGAKMLIFSDKTIIGTIGGGRFEKMVVDDAMVLFDNEAHHVKKTYRFTETGINATGMNCGGEAEVFMELLGNDVKLTIFGAGHIGCALATIATTVIKQITIVDDRQENLDNAPEHINKTLSGAEYLGNLPALDGNSYVVLVTRGHTTDLAVLSNVLKSDCRYIGMIGSKAKMVKMKSELEGDGFTQQEISKIKTPIGLDIGAEGPEEIAVAILAEIIAIKNGCAVISATV